MSTQIQIESTNYSGQTALITFYPCSGGSINLGSQVIPYTYTNNNYEGIYELYFPSFNKTCQLSIACPFTTAGFVTSISCGNMDISGGTFSITYNGDTYPLDTIYSQNTLSNLIPITYPSPGVIYDFQFNLDSGYGLCNGGLGKYNRMKVTVGTSAGSVIWNSITQFYSGSTLVYQDSSDFVTLQGSPYNLFGQTYSVNISVNGYSAVGFLINGSLLANESNDNITTENSDLLEIQ